MLQDYRYTRQINLPGFGPEAQQKLAAAKVLIVGAGGLGVPALQYLCAMGVGTIGIVDDDLVNLHNLHRQVLYTTADVGRTKVEVAAERLLALNPSVNVQPFDVRLKRDNALPLIEGFDLVIDGTDNFATRYLINDACVILGKPFVYGAAQGYEGQYSVFNFGEGPTYRCLFPEPPATGLLQDCATGGVLGVTPALIGTYQALEAVKIITGIGEVSGCLLHIHDFLNNSQRSIRLKAVPANKIRGQLETSYDEGSACTDADTISTSQLYQLFREDRVPALIDIREEWEFGFDELQNARRVAVDGLTQALPSLTDQSHIVVVCQYGKRSRAAAAWLRERLPGHAVQSLGGGMLAWNQDYPNQFLQD